MRIGKNKLKMSSGEVRSFGSEAKRNNFERMAQAVKHGWKPRGNPVISPTQVGTDNQQQAEFYKKVKSDGE